MAKIYIATKVVETNGYDETHIVGASYDIDRLKKECVGWSGKRRLTWSVNIDNETFAKTGDTYFWVTEFQILS